MPKSPIVLFLLFALVYAQEKKQTKPNKTTPPPKKN